MQLLRRRAAAKAESSPSTPPILRRGAGDNGSPMLPPRKLDLSPTALQADGVPPAETNVALLETCTPASSVSAVGGMDFVLDFASEIDLLAALTALRDMPGLTLTELVSTAGKNKPTHRVGVQAAFDLLLHTCAMLKWKRRLKQTDDWVTFSWDTRAEFANAYDATLFFTSAERVFLTSVVLKRVVPRCRSQVPLNDLELHGELSRRWLQGSSSLFSISQPLDLICNYYGEEIALYFAFLGHYTAWLVPLALLGVAVFLYQHHYQSEDEALFSWPSLAFLLATILWDTCFFESWKRKEKLLAFAWNGISGKARQEEIRIELKHGGSGAMRRMPWVVGYALSFLLLSASFAFKAWLVTRVLWMDEGVLARAHDHLPALVVSKLPNMLLATVIMATSQFNRVLAVFCTETLERRETLDEAQGAIVVKLVMQHFLNSHAVLLYIAFWEQDLDRLRSTLISLLVLNQLYGQVFEVGVPFVLSGGLTRWRRKKKPTTGATADAAPLPNQIEVEMDLVTYAGVFSDYLELWVQMGQITLYSSVFPLAALVGLVNNVIEIRTDAFRLMHTSKRPVPFSKPADIGNWLFVFECLGFASLATNASLAFVVTRHQYGQCVVDCWGDFALLLVAVAAEHAAVAAKVGLKFFIPDVPKEIASRVERTREREAQVEQQRLEHRVRVQRLVSDKTTGGGGDEQDAVVEYAVQQTRARQAAEDDKRRIETELARMRHQHGATSSLGVTVIWINLAVAACAALVLFSGM